MESMAQMFINGESVPSKSGQTYEVKNPATREVVDTAAKGTAEDIEAAVAAAEAAFAEWRHTSPEARGQHLHKGAEKVREKLDELAVLETKEQGKPVAEAKREIEHFLHGLEFYAGLASKIRGAHVPLPDNRMYGMVIKQPIGVCAGIVPWNFPITLMGTKVGPALAAGNTMIVKPASTTPLTAIRIIELLNQAGLPKGVLNIVTGPGGTLGEALLKHPRIRRIAFTGATDTGKHVAECAAPQMKRLTLELGGSDPMIVCDDAAIDAAVTGASVGRFYNCGQACLAIKRLYLFESVYDQFVEKLLGKVKRLKIGNGLEEKIRMGPLHTAAQREEIESQVADAIKRGGKVLAGGKRPEGDQYAKGFFYEPTLLENIPDDARIVQEESFGPALPIFKVKDLNEAIARANNSQYGLGSSIWTRDLTKARRAAERLEAGNVWINSLHIGYDELPFGGVKYSGIGREHGPEALEYYLESKGVVVATD
ncbi:aldehyde dehydrogenase family protein [Acidobacteriia bacterium AH_259_A11_L15]|nr:aldehyde dehydrogenase family protein [Acidobacteriia bacterium AH_259_A11_L15]